MDDEIRQVIEKAVKSMRKNMREAIKALKRDSADEFFDSLFESSEDIIRLSGLLRNPKVKKELFPILLNAVSHLGRNNAALIQKFTEMCSFIQRSPRLRTFGRTEKS